MMRRKPETPSLRAGVIALALASILCGGAAAQETPRLAVIIVVDQMRADYMENYADHFTDGLARMTEQGVSFRNAWVDHAYTNSLPGHASIATGAHPRRHGVVDNVWHERAGDAWRVRSGFSLVDRADGEPYSLAADTLGEWLAAGVPEAKFAAIGTNAAVRLYAGRVRGTVLWLSSEDGAYVTNANYAESNPDWVDRFNRQLAMQRPREWVSSVPADLARRLRPDASMFENRGEDVAFPHALSSFERFAASPMADEATLALAADAVAHLGLGADASPDLLMISLEALDSIGHAYGPFSHEQIDALLRMDRNLGGFFTRLDALVGQGNWVAVLSGDHGVATTPEQRRLDGSAEGRRVSQADARAAAQAAYAAAAVSTAPVRAAQEAIAAFDFVDRVYAHEDVASMDSQAGSAEGLLARSYWPGRVPAHPFYIRELPIAELGVHVLLKEDVMMDWATAIHGSAYDYDRRVPLLVYGAGLAREIRYDRAATVDIAPTLAARMGVRPLGPIDGRDLLGEAQG